MQLREDSPEVETVPGAQDSIPRPSIRASFTRWGILTGLVLGFYEAALLYSRPPYSVVPRPDLGPLVFLVTPLAGLLSLGFLGLALGYIADKSGSLRERVLPWLGAAGLGVAGGYTCGVSFLRFWWDKYPRISLLAGVVIAGGACISVLSGLALRKWDGGRAALTCQGNGRWFHRSRIGAVAIGMILVAATIAYRFRGSERLLESPPSPTGAQAKPNIVLITLDAAVADHLSCYGYSRPTTPYLDRVAQRGVLFENAVAPSSWTLPSFASIFTGLFPHQHGAGYASPLPENYPTLAMALRSAGYETVGFNANVAYGQTNQGIARGFDLYLDGAENLRQNFTQTLFGRAFLRFVYGPFGHPDWIERQSAEEINRKVFRWFSKRPPRPYFLFINYFDVHFPYFAPPPYARRFGELPETVAQHLNSGMLGVKLKGVASEERNSLVAGYDNTLAYTDSQIETLLESFAKSPDWSNTVVIVTADHGEAFGEHARYGHGWDLSREVLHVPLIMFGHGIPAGLRVKRVVGTRRLYATILDLAAGSKEASLQPPPLRNTWENRQDDSPAADAVISELDAITWRPRSQRVYMSVTTQQWHWILDSQGHSQLYDWVEDPQEKTDLAGSPEASALVETLQRTLRAHVITSLKPWAGLAYLQPIGLGSSELAVPQDRDLLDSLPYQ